MGNTKPPLRMCENCKETKCKENGYKYLPHCATAFQWAIFGICVAALLFLIIAAYLITRIIDGNWSSWQLPVILVICWLVSTIIGAMFCALRNIKIELKSAEPESSK